MSHTYSHKKLVFRIRHNDPTKIVYYEGNTVIGTFEFLTEENARKYITEKNLKNVLIDEVIISTSESIRTI